MLASCWVAKKILLSAASASSKARTLDSRPTTNGVIMYGKITTSRMGIIGSFFVSNFSFGVVTLAPKSYFERNSCTVTSPQADAPQYTERRGVRVSLLIPFSILSNPDGKPTSTCVLLALTSLVHHRQRDIPPFDHIAGHLELFDLLLARQVVHEIQHELFQNHAQ